jgi:hypothetical protein
MIFVQTICAISNANQWCTQAGTIDKLLLYFSSDNGYSFFLVPFSRLPVNRLFQKVLIKRPQINLKMKNKKKRFILF